MGDIIFELLLEGTVRGSINKKLSLWVRIPLMILLFGFILLYAYILFGVAGICLATFIKQQYIVSVFMFFLDVIMIIGIYKYTNQFINLKKI